MADEKRLVDINKFPLLPSRLDGDMSEYERGYLDAQANLNLLPIVDAVEVVHGTWLDWHGKPVQPGEFYRWWACSECKYQYVFDEAVKKEHFPSNYCPNCGAKMDGVQLE